MGASNEGAGNNFPSDGDPSAQATGSKGTIEQFLREERETEQGLGERLQLTRAFELCIKDAEERMARALSERDDKDEFLLIARSSLLPILGRDVVIRALAYAEEWQVRVVRVPNSRMPFLYELEAIRKRGQKCPHFYVYPGINYCKCKRFTQEVINDQSLYTCEHVLGVRLARVLHNFRGERLVNEDQMESILNEVSTLNTMDSHRQMAEDPTAANVVKDP